MPVPDRPRSRRARRLHCEACLEVLSLRHAWDVAACRCGALLLSGRPATPTVHWLSRPGGGWSEVPEPEKAETDDELDQDMAVPVRRLGFPSSPTGGTTPPSERRQVLSLMIEG